ncbi:MAG: OmpA family protein [Anaerolineales bacterium]|nr:OmpA family protein [Anaerolineales bacterium]
MSHGGGGSERWLVSYADFITLLFVLFVILYAMGQTDLEKYKELAESLHEAFSGGPAQVVDPGINQGGSGTGDSSPSPITLDDMPARLTDSLDVASRMNTILNAHDMAGDVSVHNNIEGLLISISEKLLFHPGTADLKDSAYPVLDSLAEMLQDMDNDVRVVGHTDDSPPVDPSISSNWALSVQRAVTVVEYLLESGITPDRLTASGRGEFSPVFPNDSAEHRAYNSRADIIIIYPIESEILNLNFDLFNTSSSESELELPGG